MASPSENSDSRDYRDDSVHSNEAEFNSTSDGLGTSTLQAKRSQTAGVARTGLDLNNIFTKLWGSPAEGPIQPSQQVRDPNIERVALNSGIAHRKSNSPDENTEVTLQKQIEKNQSLILSQQKALGELFGKVDNLVQLIKSSNVREGEQRSEMGCESGSEIESDDGGSHNGDRSFEISGSSEVNETRKMLIQMSGDFQKLEKMGPKIDNNLAQVVDAGISQPIDRKIAGALCEKQSRPENCEHLTVPKVNKELWVSSSLLKNIKDNDRKFQTTQNYLTCGLVPLVNLMDCLLKTNQYKEFELAKDAFQLLAYAHRDMTNLRRQHIRPGINEKYKQLCNDNTPLTNNLLGDDLEIQLKSMDTMRRLSTDISRAQSDYNKNKHRKRDYRGMPVQSGSKQSLPSQPRSNHFLWKKSRPQQQSADKRQQVKPFRK